MVNINFNPKRGCISKSRPLLIPVRYCIYGQTDLSDNVYCIIVVQLQCVHIYRLYMMSMWESIYDDEDFYKVLHQLRHYILSFWAYASTFLNLLCLPSQRHRKKKSMPASQLSVHLDSLSRCMVMYAIITSPLLAETTKVGCKWHCLFCYPFFYRKKIWYHLSKVIIIIMHFRYVPIPFYA